MKLFNLTKTSEDKMASAFNNEDKEFREMKVNENAMAHIISRLTDLYEDPILATTREVISNAIDATRKLKEEDRLPIEITAPNAIKREFIVEDFGVGMSKDEMSAIYSQYGVSTKANDLTQTGAFGLGAKAPLSYCTSFLVESVKDGMYTKVILSSEDDGNYARFVSHEPTERRNGTKVTIPVKEEDLDAFGAGPLSTYQQYSFDVEIDLIGIETDEDEFKFLSSIPIDSEGRVINLYYNPRNSSELREILMNPYFGAREFDLILSGYNYSKKRTYFSYRPKPLAIEVIPGLFDFDSSRDSIIKNERYEFVIDTLDKIIKNNRVSYLNKVISDGNIPIREVLQYTSVHLDRENPSADLCLSSYDGICQPDGTPLADIFSNVKFNVTPIVTRVNGKYLSALSWDHYLTQKENEKYLASPVSIKGGYLLSPTSGRYSASPQVGAVVVIKPTEKSPIYLGRKAKAISDMFSDSKGVMIFLAEGDDFESKLAESDLSQSAYDIKVISVEELLDFEKKNRKASSREVGPGPLPLTEKWALNLLEITVSKGKGNCKVNPGEATKWTDFDEVIILNTERASINAPIYPSQVCNIKEVLNQMTILKDKKIGIIYDKVRKTQYRELEKAGLDVKEDTCYSYDFFNKIISLVDFDFNSLFYKKLIAYSPLMDLKGALQWKWEGYQLSSENQDFLREVFELLDKEDSVLLGLGAIKSLSAEKQNELLGERNSIRAAIGSIKTLLRVEYAIFDRILSGFDEYLDRDLTELRKRTLELLGNLELALPSDN